MVESMRFLALLVVTLTTVGCTVYVSQSAVAEATSLCKPFGGVVNIIVELGGGHHAKARCFDGTIVEGGDIKK
jgi:hypothetical protein